MTPDGGPGAERDSFGERALDLLVFAPVGLVATAIEELPALVTKGRDRLDPQVRSAHAIGRLTVDFGTREMARRASRLLHRGPGTSGAAPAYTPPADPAAPTPTGSPSPTGTSTASSAASPRPKRQAATAPRAAGAPRAASAEAGSRPTVDLAIPGYDTLSASQVVRRLDGLGEAELDAVYRYESSSRGRRTILHRVHQIREGQETSGDPRGAT